MADCRAARACVNQLRAEWLTLVAGRIQPCRMTVLADPIHFFGAQALQDPYPVYDRMRSDSPVQRIGGSDFYAVCGWDAVQEAVERVEDFSSNLTATMVYRDDSVQPFPMMALGDAGHALATADDPVHAMHRKILLPHLSARRVSIIEEHAAQTADRLWDENLRDGRIEWMGALANRLPMMVVARLLGLLRHHDVAGRCRHTRATGSRRPGGDRTVELCA
jgi:cytochrome P450 family 144